MSTNDMVTVMERLGFPRFSVAGHDRGGRVAYRTALDHPDRIDRLAVLDILPAESVWDLADARFALAYWPCGALDTWYVEESGPIALWRAWGDDVRRRALEAGHFFLEEAPEQTADALNRFFGATESS